ncbi:unnamed protein product, partial [Discosporangium mesarthrocarpum]
MSAYLFRPSSSPQADLALSLIRGAKAEGVKIQTSAYNAAITACAHAGAPDKALPLLKEMRDRGIPRNAITY